MTTTPPQATTGQTAHADTDALARLAQHLVSETIGRYCDIATDDSKTGVCQGRAVAVRWENGWADNVCVEHATTAAERGALVVHARRHDGSNR